MISFGLSYVSYCPGKKKVFAIEYGENIICQKIPLKQNSLKAKSIEMLENFYPLLILDTTA